MKYVIVGGVCVLVGFGLAAFTKAGAYANQFVFGPPKTS